MERCWGWCEWPALPLKARRLMLPLRAMSWVHSPDTAKHLGWCLWPVLPISPWSVLPHKLMLMSMGHGAAGDHVCLLHCQSEAIVMSVVWAASEGLVWIQGLIAAWGWIRGMCCHPSQCGDPQSTFPLTIKSRETTWLKWLKTHSWEKRNTGDFRNNPYLQPQSHPKVTA